MVILGAGAAGLMCAMTAGQRGKTVLVLDHADKAGKKILISGGGRCNFTNIFTQADAYISGNRHFAKSALSRYTPADFLALVERHGIAWHEKTLGQLFCDGSAREIVAMLLAECREAGVSVATGVRVSMPKRDGAGFALTAGARRIRAKALVIATGGPSIPKMGATGFAYDVARGFGVDVVPPRPALVPLTLGRDAAFLKDLSGVATDVVASLGKRRFREAALFTHKGLSGPAILQISSYWRSGERIGLNLLPDLQSGWLLDAKRQQPRAGLKTALARHLPERLARALADKAGVRDALGNVADKRLVALEEKFADWQVLPSGTEGFAKAEVTVGGVSTDALSSRTMQVKNCPGLYFIGEAVDVTGWLGGYNFQWAWSSGYAAGCAV